MQTLHVWERALDTVLSVLVVITLVIHFTHLIPQYDVLILGLVTALGILPVLINAYRSIKDGAWASMDTLALVALFFSVIEGELSSAVFIAGMLTAARILERNTEERMERSIKSLMKLKPSTAKVIREGTLQELPVDTVAAGDIVIVDTGERIAVDGTVASGMATVDESSLTGESLPVDKTAGDTVSSSTLVTSGTLTLLTTRVGKDTTLERIIALVESAREEKPHLETIGQRFGKIYLITIFLLAATLLFFTRDTALVLAVVLVVCADDVAVAIPLTYLRAISIAAKRGVVIKGGRHLETLGTVDTIVFDKTGTLTEGRPKVYALVGTRDEHDASLLPLALPVLKRSSHPLATSVVEYAAQNKIEALGCKHAEVISGKGIVGTVSGRTVIVGNATLLADHGIEIPPSLTLRVGTHTDAGRSIMYIGEDGNVRGFIALGDTVKKDARAVVDRLHTLGVKRVVMLSGDNERAAQSVAHSVGLDEYHANMLPEDKVVKLRELSKTGIVAMVGDGVNDAAALSLAHVGIAMGGLGSDGAIESANIVLMHDNLSAIPDTIDLARHVRRIARQDFMIWGSSNVVGLSLVFLGIIGPMGAAAYNFISDFFPLANSLRIPRQ